MVEPGLDNFLCEFCVGVYFPMRGYLSSIILVPRAKEMQKESHSGILFQKPQRNNRSVHVGYFLLPKHPETEQL